MQQNVGEMLHLADHLLSLAIYNPHAGSNPLMPHTQTHLYFSDFTVQLKQPFFELC